MQPWRGQAICPWNRSSCNAPALVDVARIGLLSTLDGHGGCAQLGALRGDGVAPSILQMKRGEYTVHDIERCAPSSRAVALVYN